MTREDARVLSLADAGAGYRLLRLFAPAVAASAAPGQFAHVRVPGLEPTALRRPLSLCDADPASGAVEILFKTVGRGTAALARVRPGDAVDLVGPLGNGFPFPAPGVRPVFVGGGYGVAPLHFLARRISEAGGDGGAEAPAGGAARPRPILFAGARTAADLLLLDRFEALGADVRAATDDGSAGAKGLVTDALDTWLAARPPDDSPPVLYACGPAPMLRAVDGRAGRLGCDAWLSLDRRMACGVGACFGCVQMVRAGDGAAPVRVCSDGPVFPWGVVVWDA